MSRDLHGKTMGELLRRGRGKGSWLEMGLEKNHTRQDLQASVRSSDFKTSGKMLWSLTGKCYLLDSTCLM